MRALHAGLAIAAIVSFPLTAPAQQAAPVARLSTANGGFAGAYYGFTLGGTRADYSRDPCCAGPEGWRGGAAATGLIGWNWQRAATVYGVEADLSARHVEAPARFGFGPWRIGAGATLRGRVGMVRNGTLYFLAAGVGAVKVSVPGASKWVTAPTLGVGLESGPMAARLGLGGGWRLRADVSVQPLRNIHLSQPTVGTLGGKSLNTDFRIGLVHNF